MQLDENSRRLALKRSAAILRAAMLPGMSLRPAAEVKPAPVLPMQRSLVNRCKCGQVISANKTACLLCKAETLATR